MTRAVIGLVLSVAAGPWVAPAAPVPPGAGTPRPFHPTATGTEWVYDCGDGVVTKTITDVDDKGACKVVTMLLRTDVAEGDRATLVMRVSGAGLADLEYRDEVADRPVDVVRLPAKEGDSWKVEWAVSGAVRYAGEVTVGKPEVVEVPAGKFECVRLDWEYALGERRVRRTYWYAPGVGVVRMKGSTQEMRLKSFKLGED